MKHYKTKSHVPDHIEFFKKLFIRIFISLVLSLALAYLLKFFVIFPYKVKNDFMEPNIARNSNVFISYLFSREKLSIGDIILVRIHSDSSVLLARIVGIKGDRISIKNKKLFRNGNLISEKNNIQFTDKRSPFAGSFSKRDNLEDVLVKDKTYFLLVDNRDEGIDSRKLGLFSEESIIGKLLF